MKSRRMLVLAVWLAVGTTIAAQSIYDKPNPATTPGATNPEIQTAGDVAATICNKAWSTKSVRPSSSFTTAIKKKQMAALGYTVGNPLPRVPTANGKSTRFDLTKCVARSGNPACWEEDHRVPLEVAGCPTCETNLWPQPWNSRWGAHSKDKLENRIHADLCAGKIALDDAQAVFLGDWTVGYKKFLK